MTQGSDTVGRREILKHGALAITAIAGTSSMALTQQPAVETSTEGSAGGAIDAHAHVWTPDVRRYPLAAGFSVAEMRPASFTPEQLMAHARPAGVDRVVLIQMSYYGFDNRYMLDAMRGSPGAFGGVAVVDEHAGQLRQTMRELKSQGVRGFRIHPKQQPADRWLFQADMESMWKIGAEEQLAMCALVNPEALAPLDAMCAKFPETPLVVDHFARIGIDEEVRASDVDSLCRLARHRRTYVKVSAFYALGQKKSPYTDLAPMIRRLLSAFGAERLMWGSDCPYQIEEGHNYRDSIELVRSRLDFLTPADRAWLLGKTAQRVFFS
jgi:predicted TIM-barrel fold metal-dependent hydrolase